VKYTSRRHRVWCYPVSPLQLACPQQGWGDALFLFCYVLNVTLTLQPKPDLRLYEKCIYMRALYTHIIYKEERIGKNALD